MRTIVTWVLSVCLVASPQASLAVSADASEAGQKANGQRLKLKNIELSPGGVLRGQYVNSVGTPQQGQVVVATIGSEQHELVTDRDGRFEIGNLSGGRCVLDVGGEVFACQVWANGTAPPKSLKSIAVVQTSKSEVRANPIFPTTVAPLTSLSTSGKVALGLLIISGATIAIVEASDEDGS